MCLKLFFKKLIIKCLSYFDGDDCDVCLSSWRNLANAETGLDEFVRVVITEMKINLHISILKLLFII